MDDYGIVSTLGVTSTSLARLASVDGQCCCTHKEVNESIGHRVVVYGSLSGPVEGTGHYFANMQMAPSSKK